MLRLPDGMRERIAETARQNGRSMNAEIVARLEETMERDASLDELWKKVELLESYISDIDDRLGITRYEKKNITKTDADRMIREFDEIAKRLKETADPEKLSKSLRQGISEKK